MERVVRHFQEELEQLKARLLEMGGLAEERVRRPSRAWSSATRRWSTRVLGGDEPINQLHIEIDNRCFKLLALHQPMAADLRAIVVGGQDQHRPRARRRPRRQHRRGGAALHATHPPVKKLIDIPRMADIAQAHAARRARRLRPPRHRRSPSACSNEDDALDALKTQVFRELLTYMLQDPAHHRAGARPDPDLPPPRADRRPRHQRRRGRHLHGLGARRPAPRARAI